MKRSAFFVVFACALALLLAGCTQGPSTPAAGSGQSSGSGTAAEDPSAGSSSATGSANTAPADGATAPEASTPAATLDKFNQVKKGMALAEVEKIMGGPGTQITEGSSGDIKVAQYGWYGTDVTTVMTVSFLNGAVSATGQSGLK